ncbi:MAG: hypothetical protein ABR953_03395 [Candidatus Acidiferrales bacterium]|jgi:hypothetical protein
MNRWMRHLLLLSGICSAFCTGLPAAASDLGTVKCPANQDRVWVYDSLSSFDVEAKLRCGETVEIVSRVKGYVKIRTVGGLEGYLPDSVFPDLPPLDDDKDKLGNHNAGAPSEIAVNTPTSIAAAAAAYRTVPKLAPKPAPVAESPATTEAVAVNAPKPAAAILRESPRVVASVASSAPSSSASATALQPAASEPASTPVKPAPIPVSAPRPKAASPAVLSEAKPAVVATRMPAPQPSAPNVPGNATASTLALIRMESPITVPSPAAAVSAPGAASLAEISAVKPKPIATVPESEDYPDAQPDDESADPQCRIFFSAYGLGASQYKWLSESRRKQFGNICPAPNVASVDFVILFTHDSDSYNSALPTPVHTDGNGFSDFSPMTTVDSALMSPSDADKARYELVWVFHMNRGAFDPARFSPRRRPQFTNVSKGSHASTRAMEDAFNFIEQQASPSR